MYTIPVDLYGAERAAFGVSALVFAYGAMQSVVSKPLGWVIEHNGFRPVCFTFAFLPLLGCLALNAVVRTKQNDKFMLVETA